MRDRRETAEYRMPLLAMSGEAAMTVHHLRAEIERLKKRRDELGGPAPRMEVVT